MIQILRGTSTQRASQTQSSVIGQPLYETDTKKLYIGDGSTAINELHAVNPGVDIAFVGALLDTSSYVTLLVDLSDLDKQSPFSPSGSPDTYYAGKYAIILRTDEINDVSSAAGISSGTLVKLGNFVTSGKWNYTTAYTEGFEALGNFVYNLSADLKDISSKLDSIRNPIIPTVDTKMTTLIAQVGNWSQAGPYGKQVFTDGKDIYFMNYTGFGQAGKFNPKTETFDPITMSGFYSETDYRGEDVWFDGSNLILCVTDSAFVFNPSTLHWDEESFNGTILEVTGKPWSWNGRIYSGDGYSGVMVYTPNPSSPNHLGTWEQVTLYPAGTYLNDNGFVWTDGKDIFCDNESYHYVLNQETSTYNTLRWTEHTWDADSGLSIQGNNIFTDGKDIYCYQGLSSSTIIVARLENGRWVEDGIQLPEAWSGVSDLTGKDFWNDGSNLYLKASNTNYKITRRVTTSATPMFGYEYGTIALTSDVIVRSNVGNIGYSKPAADTIIASGTWTGTSSGPGTNAIAYVTISGRYIELDYAAIGGTYTNGDTYGSMIRLQRNMAGTWKQIDSFSSEEQVVDNEVTPVSHSFSSYQSGDRYYIQAYASRYTPPVAIAFNAICTYKELGVDGDGNTLADIRISGVPNITESPTPPDALINTVALANVIGVNSVSFSQLNTRATVGSLNSNIYTANLCASNNCIGIHAMGNTRGINSLTYSNSPVDITIYGAQIS